jgi:hypothetical protein
LFPTYQKVISFLFRTHQKEILLGADPSKSINSQIGECIEIYQKNNKLFDEKLNNALKKLDISIKTFMNFSYIGDYKHKSYNQESMRNKIKSINLTEINDIDITMKKSGFSKENQNCNKINNIDEFKKKNQNFNKINNIDRFSKENLNCRIINNSQKNFRCSYCAKEFKSSQEIYCHALRAHPNQSKRRSSKEIIRKSILNNEKIIEEAKKILLEKYELKINELKFSGLGKKLIREIVNVNKKEYSLILEELKLKKI